MTSEFDGAVAFGVEDFLLPAQFLHEFGEVAMLGSPSHKPKNHPLYAVVLV